MKLKGKYNAHTIHIFNKYRINIHIYTLISLLSIGTQEAEDGC